LRQKARNGRGQKKIGRWLRCSEAQCTGRLAAELIGRFQRRLMTRSVAPTAAGERLLARLRPALDE
jgi:hypothetical protein